MKDRWLTVDEVREYLSFPSREAVYCAIRTGKLPAYKLGKRMIRLRKSEVDASLKRIIDIDLDEEAARAVESI